MNPVERFLERLDGVRPNGANKWTAKCPVHTDKTSSLSIRETDDGNVLVYCFAGCTVGDVVNAVGLEIKDLFTPRESNWKPSSAPRPRTLANLPALPAAVLEHHRMRKFFRAGVDLLEHDPKAFAALACWLGDCIRLKMGVR